jgi:WD40-like Beta Propeller Repeat
MNRNARRAGPLLILFVLLLASCGSGAEPADTTVTPSAVSTVGTTVATTAGGAASTTSIPESLCTSQREDRGPGDRGVGTSSNDVAFGRVLIVIEAAAGPSGTFALGYIDPDGWHEIVTEPDFTMAHQVWESADTILFDSERNGDRHIFRMTIDDGAVEQLTDGALTGQQNPVVLPDGRFVYEAYSCEEEVDFGLEISSPDGNAVSDLTPGRVDGDPGFDQQPDVSPDGTSIVFIRNADEQHGALFVVTSEGGEERRLTADMIGIDRPRWSPDGRTIMYDQGDRVWVVDASGGDPHVLVDKGFEADWSPNGSQIVFKVYQQGWNHNELHVADADGANEWVLWVGEDSTAELPDWGP